jgi:hypothetical protein
MGSSLKLIKSSEAGMASSEVLSRAAGDSEVSSPWSVGGNRNGGASLVSSEPWALSGLAGGACEFAINL